MAVPQRSDPIRIDLPRLLQSRVVSALLLPLEAGYRLGLRVHERKLERRFASGEWPLRLPRPVISVGNLVAGGAGKTPVVEALAKAWVARGGTPAILSRGYGAPNAKTSAAGEKATGNDEFRMLARRLPGVPHQQNPDRYAGGLALLAERPDVDLLILDDGYQHRRLHRDVNLALIDLTRPYGYGHCLPRGLLREPWSALSRADAFVLTRGEDCSETKRAIVTTFLRERFPRTPRIEADLQFDGLIGPTGEALSVPEGRTWAAFAGVGNPQAFFRNLPSWGIRPVAVRSFPDHYRFQVSDSTSLQAWAREHGADALVCTEKDGVKLAELPGFSELAVPCYQTSIHFDLGTPHPLDLLPPLA